MNGLMKIGRGLATFILAYLLVSTIVMVVFVTDIRATVMNAGWVESEMDKGGFYTAINEEFKDQVNENLDENLEGEMGEEEVQNIRDAVDDALTTVTDDWIKINFEKNINLAYAYLKSESDNPSFSLTLPEDLKETIKDSIDIIFADEDNWPEGLSQDEVEDGIAAVKQQVDYLPNEITLHLLDVENVDELQIARDVIKIYDYVFYTMIALAFFVVALLILLHFTIKDAARVLGVNMLIGGIICLVEVIVLKSIAPRIIGGKELSDHITGDMIVQVIRDSTTPALIFSIVLIVVAVLLIVASFFTKRKEKCDDYNLSA